MQVSWIDPHDVASLAESLRTPPPALPAEEEGYSLLDPDDVAAVKESFASWNAPTENRSVQMPAGDDEGPLPAVERPSQEGAGEKEGGVSSDVLQQSGPNLDAFRERLQAIRNRAVNAGLLPPQAAAEETPGPVATPEVVNEPEPELEPEEEPEVPRFSAFAVPMGSVGQRLEAFAAWAHQALGTDQVYVVDDLGDLLWGPQDQASLILSTLLALSAAARSSAMSACEGPQVLHHRLRSGMTMTVIPCHTRLGVIQVAVADDEAITAEDAEPVRSALMAAMEPPE